MGIDANTRNWIIGGVIAIIIIVLGWWLLTKPGSNSMATSTAATTTTTTTGTDTGTTTGMMSSSTVTTAASGESVSVADQPAGSSVAVTGVTTSKVSWIAVRDALHVLGAARVDAMTNGTVTVPLLRATTAGSTYQVVVYVDDGDRTFDLHKDALVDGVGSSFTAQ